MSTDFEQLDFDNLVTKALASLENAEEDIELIGPIATLLAVVVKEVSSLRKRVEALEGGDHE